ncbi:MAG: CDP-alcohol phosphatidyltransferase family protein [Candidatus Omnitrophota bacterium]
MKKWVNIPNTLSTMRIMTIPVIMYLIFHTTPQTFPILITVYFFSICLDFFDGFLARKLSQETELGKILDPIADKLMVFALVFSLIVKADFPLWLGIVIVARDILILIAGAVIFKGKHTILSSILVGKITFGLLSALLLIYILDLSVSIDLEVLKNFFVPLCTCFIAWSFLEYYKIYIRKKHEY